MSALATIHVGCKQLGIAEDDRRDLYERVTGKRSLREMTPKEHEAVIADLRSKGFRKVFGKGSKRRLQGKYAGKLQALWIGAWNLGLIRNRSDDALTAFVKRQTGIDHTRFLRYPEDAAKAIEALKGWMARDGGVDWGTGLKLPTYMKLNGARIAIAQWEKLPKEHPEKIAGSFWQFVARHSTINNITHANELHFIPVMNALGHHVRALK